MNIVEFVERTQGIQLSTFQNSFLLSNIQSESMNHTQCIDAECAQATPCDPHKTPDKLAKYSYEYSNYNERWYIRCEGFSVDMYYAWSSTSLEEQYGQGSYVVEIYREWAVSSLQKVREDFKKKTGRCEELNRPPHPNSLDCLQVTPVQAFVPKRKRKDKTAMSDYAIQSEFDYGDTVATSLAAKKVDYLTGRLHDAFDAKNTELQRMFHLIDDQAPRTPEELIERIKAGKFTLPEKDKRRTYWGAYDQIIWRDPSAKKDQDGYDAAFDLLEKERTKAKDAIMISDPADGLKAIQALEAWTPTGAAN